MELFNLFLAINKTLLIYSKCPIFCLKLVIFLCNSTTVIPSASDFEHLCCPSRTFSLGFAMCFLYCLCFVSQPWVYFARASWPLTIFASTSTTLMLSRLMVCYSLEFTASKVLMATSHRLVCWVAVSKVAWGVCYASCRHLSLSLFNPALTCSRQCASS